VDAKIATNSGRAYVFDAPVETAVCHLRFRREREGEGGTYEALASGFFLSGWGLFATARHCIAREDDSLHDPRDLQVLVETPHGLVGCSVVDVVGHPSADVAIGAIARPSEEVRKQWEFRISSLRLDRELPEPGDALVAFGWAGTYLSQEEPGGVVNHNLEKGTFDGAFRQFHPGGFTLCKWPCLEHTVPIIGQMSGSPLIRIPLCTVVGVNSSGTHDYGVATDSRLLLDMVIPFGPDAIRGRRLAEILADEGL